MYTIPCKETMEEPQLVEPEVRLRQLIVFMATQREVPEQVQELADQAMGEILQLLAEKEGEGQGDFEPA